MKSLPQISQFVRKEFTVHGIFFFKLSYQIGYCESCNSTHISIICETSGIIPDFKLLYKKA